MRYSLKTSVILLAAIFALSSPGCKTEKKPQIGIVVPTGDERVSDEIPFVIHEVLENTPAHRAGLQGDDVIIQIDGIVLKGLTHGYVYKNILLGKRGTVATLVILRDGEKKVIQLIRGGEK